MVLMRREQLDWLNYAWVGLVNVSVNGGSTAITNALSTALDTAGDGGVSVPLRAATAADSGVVVTQPDNTVIVRANANKLPITPTDTDVEVYGRLTVASSVYTVTFYTLGANGAETPYSFSSATNVDLYIVYQFDAATWPRNAAVSINSRIIQQDPNSSAARVRFEKLTVTALNTLSQLTKAPSLPTNIILYVNGKAEHALSGGSFSVSGTTITWNAVAAKYNLSAGADVAAMYW